MPYLHNYRLFVSHAWQYSDGYQRMIQRLDEAPNFIYSNYSIPVSKAFAGLNKVQLQDQLQRQIAPVQTVIIMAGMYVAHSEWIQFEIDYAKRLRKPILGVIPWSALKVPAAVQNAANEMVNWNAASIVSGIRRITP